jgi:hypothetical protein
MTRKDFCLIAEVIRNLPSFDVKSLDGADCVRFSALVARFADALTTTNPRFNRSRFENACHGKESR